jgi:hypothetical protein
VRSFGNAKNALSGFTLLYTSDNRGKQTAAIL